MDNDDKGVFNQNR